MTGGRSGICWPKFMSGHNTAPVKVHHLNMNYQAIKGLMTVQSEFTLGAFLSFFGFEFCMVIYH